MALNERLAELSRMRAEGSLTDEEFETLCELANIQESEKSRLIELAQMKARGILSDQEFEALTKLAENQLTMSKSSTSSNSDTTKATPLFLKRNLLIGSAVAIVAVVFASFFVLGNSSGDSDNGGTVSNTEVYEERVRVLKSMLGMSSSELTGYAITCGVNLSDVSVPFSYVTSVLLPVLTPEQLNKSFADAFLGVDKPRCLYAQGG